MPVRVCVRVCVVVFEVKGSLHMSGSIPVPVVLLIASLVR